MTKSRLSSPARPITPDSQRPEPAIFDGENMEILPTSHSGEEANSSNVDSNTRSRSLAPSRDSKELSKKRKNKKLSTPSRKQSIIPPTPDRGNGECSLMSEGISRNVCSPPSQMFEIKETPLTMILENKRVSSSPNRNNAQKATFKQGRRKASTSKGLHSALKRKNKNISASYRKGKKMAASYRKGKKMATSNRKNRKVSSTPKGKAAKKGFKSKTSKSKTSKKMVGKGWRIKNLRRSLKKPSHKKSEKKTQPQKKNKVATKKENEKKGEEPMKIESSS